jgi:hypothetical protein
MRTISSVWRGIGRIMRKRAGMIQAASEAAGPEGPPNSVPSDQSIIQRVAAFTMKSTARQVALLEAVHYVVRRGIVGDRVECGVWRGTIRHRLV